MRQVANTQYDQIGKLGILSLALLLMGGLSRLAHGEARDDLSLVGPDSTVLADAEIWPAVNWASFDQDKVVSYGSFQYSVYCDSDRALAVARRNLSTDEVQTVRLETYVLAAGRPEAQQRNASAKPSSSIRGSAASANTPRKPASRR